MRVVILAAGMGTRLGGDRPKPLAEIAPGWTLLSHQVDVFGRLIGRDRVVLVLGYAAGDIMAAHPELSYVFNPCYSRTNTAKSLLTALRKLDDDVLWTNADLYFEEPAAQRLLSAHSLGTRLLVNRDRVTEEEIKYTLHPDGSIAELSKSVTNPLGEALGMNIVAQRDLPTLVAMLESVADTDYFEKAIELVTLSGAIRALPVPIEDEYCREVDFPADLEAVRKRVADVGIISVKRAPSAANLDFTERRPPDARSGPERSRKLKPSIPATESPALHRIGVYGVGAFGFAMLQRLQQKTSDQLSLMAFDRDAEVRRMLRSERRHPYHATDTPLRTEVKIADSIEDLLADLDTLLLAVTSDSTREVVAGIAALPWRRPLVIVNTAKALDYQTGRRLSELVRDGLDPAGKSFTYAALAGGAIASDLLHNEPLGMTIACEDLSIHPSLKTLFASQNLWIETTADLVGVEYAGAFKNVVAICAGMVRGLGRSYGSITHLISRLAREIENFCVRHLGADRETFSSGSQCWGSDLWMSCTGETRNQALGRLLGQGLSLNQANTAMAREHKTVEGVQTLRAVQWLVARHEAELPLLTIAKEIVLDGASPSRLLEELMREDANG